MCVLFVLPTSHPVSAMNMNYAVVAIGGVLVLVVLGWFAWGRKSFFGSVVTRADSDKGHGEPLRQ